MREDRQGTWVEMDDGEAFQIEERASVIAESVQRPTVTIVATPAEDSSEKRARR
jgi:hypothetical protein